MSQSFEEALEIFEREFNSGKEPDIRQFLQAQTDSSLDLLYELIHTELELRLRSGQPARVETYMEQFPELSNDPTVLRELVRTELSTRRNFDPACRLEEYIVRFPDMRDSLVEEFLTSTFGSDAETEVPDPGNLRKPKVFGSHSDLVARFRKQRLHEQGGLGNVWIAEDKELKRNVVLKEVKSKYANSETHRARFSRETRITGSLEHPGIVPVYGQGHSHDGTPFFAMQYIAGNNLQNVIREFHKQDSHQRPLKTFSRLLQHFVDVCDTIEYAHSQGVIHRDIKPGNILVGQFGETYLIDWGLACNLHSGNPKPTSREPVNSGESDNELLSRDGQTIGSPAYMSPEQAEGRLDQINFSTDVYGLGATLYSLLTGCENPNREARSQSAFSTKNHQDGENSTQPLNSICRKAMSKNPAQRYGSVRLMREDIESFLMDKPVKAHQDSVSESLGRFLRRNRALLNAALVSLILISLVSSAAAIWINAERNAAVLAREQEFASRQNSEMRTDQLTSVFRIFVDALVGSDDAGLQVDPDKVTARQIVNQMENRINENSDPIVQALLNAVIARGLRGSGDYNDAIDKYRTAIKLAETEQIQPEDPLYADLLCGLTSTLQSIGDNEEAAEHIETIKLAYKKNPEQLETNFMRVLLLEVKGAIRQRDFERALDVAMQANELGRKIYAESPDHNNMIWANYTLANAYRRTGKSETAAAIFEEIIATLKDKNKTHGTGIGATVQLSEMRQESNPREAETLIEQASRDSGEYFGIDHPDTIEIDARHGRLLAHPRNDSDKREQGIEILESAHQRMIEKLGSTCRESLGTAILLTESLLSFGDESKTKRAATILEETLASLQFSDDPSKFAAFIASFHDKLATARIELHDRSNAIEAMKQAIDWCIKAYGKDSSISTRLQEKLETLEGENSSE